MKKRGKWSSTLVFLIATTGSAVGLGNIWRFPYIAHAHGGGAFFLPYLILLFTIGIPLLAFEFALGQRFQQGPLGAFGHQAWSTIGMLALSISAVVSAYYTVIIAWTLLYLINTFTGAWFSNPSHYFTTIHGAQLIIPLALIWIAVAFALHRGLRSIERIVRIIVPLPVILLLIMLVRSLFLPGALDGILQFITPTSDALFNPSTWAAALGQLFFSLSIGFGTMITYASFQPRTSPTLRNATIVGIADTAIATIAGLVVFATLGAMSSATNTARTIASGPELAFIAFPNALLALPLPTLFAAIFFATLFLLGFSSQVATTYAITNALSQRMKTTRATLLTCGVGFLTSLAFINGTHLISIIDHFAVEYGLVIVALLEVHYIGWITGCTLLNFIRAQTPHALYTIAGRAITRYILPLALITLLIHTLINDLTTLSVRQNAIGIIALALLLGSTIAYATYNGATRKTKRDTIND